MGVYVNEDMPKDCYTCFCYETEFNMCSLTGKRLGNIRIRQDDCPLIDIVRCGECEYADEYNHCKYSAWWNGNADFCSHGIRRKESR